MQSRVFRILSGLLFAFYIGVVPTAAMAKGGSDHDGLPQRWERRHGTNPNVHDAGLDLDSDRLTNRGEFKFHTDPRDADSDDDGFMDGEEVRTLHTNPNEADGENSDEEACDDDDGAEADDDDGAEDADEPGDIDEIDDAEGAEDDDTEEEDEGTEDDDEDEAEDEAEDEDEAGDVDVNDEDEADEDDAEECEDEDEGDDDGEDEQVVATIESYNSSTGRLTLKTTDDRTVTGIVTDDTELEWESLDGSESESEASTSDLDPGQKVADYEFEDGSDNFSEVGLAK